MSDASLMSAATVTTGRAKKISMPVREKRRLSKTGCSTDSETPTGQPSKVQATSASETMQQFLLPKSIEGHKSAEEEMEDMVREAAERRATISVAPGIPCDDRTAAALNDQVLTDIGVIMQVATKSKNLKGTFIRALKDATASIKIAVDSLLLRTSSEETAKLQEENTRLRCVIQDLKTDMAELRKEVEQINRRSTPIPAKDTNSSQEIASIVMRQVGTMIDARFEAMEERLLPARRIRPPLASDKRCESGMAMPSGNDSQDEDLIRTGSHRIESERAGESWATVVRRKSRNRKKKNNGRVQNTSVGNSGSRQVENSRHRQPRLRTPRSAAIVISLQPGAEDRGITYAQVLAEAKQKVDLASLGITALRYRQAATGARILEIPGEASSEKADSLAEKLRASLPIEVAKVTRPIKCADMRITGLDDSVTAEEVIDAVTKQGICSIETVKAGEIRRSTSGTGILWVRCPIAAAKKIGSEGRLLVGWISARVQLLQPRPTRCYRCLQIGHVHAQCTSEADRSNLCYRCGLPDHKAITCAREPNCPLCSAGNIPANHVLGSKQCSPPKHKSGKSITENPPKPRDIAIEAMLTN